MDYQVIKTNCFSFVDTRQSQMLITGGLLVVIYFYLRTIGIDINGEIQSSVYVYDLKTNQISKGSNMLQARYGHQLIKCGEFIYALGGETNGSIRLRTCEKFDLKVFFNNN